MSDNIIYKYDGVKGRRISSFNLRFNGKQAKGQVAFERLINRIKKYAAETDSHATIRFLYGRPHRVNATLEVDV